MIAKLTDMTVIGMHVSVVLIRYMMPSILRGGPYLGSAPLVRHHHLYDTILLEDIHNRAMGIYSYTRKKFT